MNIVVHGSLTVHQSSHRVAYVWPLGQGPMCPPRVDQDTSGLYCFKQATCIPCGGPCAIKSKVFLSGSSGKFHTNGLVTWSDKCNACFKPLQFLTPVLLRSPTVRIVGVSPRVQYSDKVRHTSRPYTQHTCTLQRLPKLRARGGIATRIKASAPCTVQLAEQMQKDLLLQPLATDMIGVL